MKIIREYSDKEEDFQKAIKLLIIYIMRKLNENNNIKTSKKPLEG